MADIWTPAQYQHYLATGERPGQSTPPPTVDTERQLQAQLRAIARRLGYLHYHTHRSDKSEPGFPDSTLVHREHSGTLYFVELKRTGESPTLPQQEWLDRLSQVHTVHVQVLYPDDLAPFTRLLMRT